LSLKNEEVLIQFERWFQYHTVIGSIFSGVSIPGSTALGHQLSLANLTIPLNRERPYHKQELEGTKLGDAPGRCKLSATPLGTSIGILQVKTYFGENGRSVKHLTGFLAENGYVPGHNYFKDYFRAIVHSYITLPPPE